MSFSVTFKVEPDESVEDAFEAADLVNKQVAIEAGGDLLTSALVLADDFVLEVAQDTESVQVSISGHWNGGVEPKPGWASNALTISVTQIYNPAKE